MNQYLCTHTDHNPIRIVPGQWRKVAYTELKYRGLSLSRQIQKARQNLQRANWEQSYLKHNESSILSEFFLVDWELINYFEKDSWFCLPLSPVSTKIDIRKRSSEAQPLWMDYAWLAPVFPINTETQMSLHCVPQYQKFAAHKKAHTIINILVSWSNCFFLTLL